METYTWTAKRHDGITFEFSFIATTPEEARKGVLAQLHEIKKLTDIDKFRKAQIHTEFISDDPFIDITYFSKTAKLESGELLWEYITRTEPTVSPFMPARIRTLDE
jgi:hypothetical protein